MLFKSFRNIFVFVMLSLMLGCAYAESRFEQRVEPQLDRIIFYQRPVLDKAQSGYYVYPASNAPFDIKAIFFPFYANPNSGGNYNTGRRIGHIFWRTWLGQEVFTTMLYEDIQEWPGRRRAGEIARAKGADLFVMGQINHYLNGGTQGTTSVGITVNIFSAQNNSLIWSMEHAGRIDNRGEMDFLLIKRRTWMPESPEYVIVNNLAYDLAQPVRNWTQGLFFEQTMNQPGPQY
ncbi:hypothetical protein [Desulfonatronovibrio magnus]|uniref:hypothetical protein n=1 Tax=Desulfonatronovibrio magnus TaxID=698827 RepID=UPI0005EACE13|nr:hypothetical protein [Desulfonatronovibrio magnus]